MKSEWQVAGVISEFRGVWTLTLAIGSGEWLTALVWGDLRWREPDTRRGDYRLDTPLGSRLAT